MQKMRQVWLAVMKALGYIWGTWCCRCGGLGAEKGLLWKYGVGG